jgi:5-methylcytosine-specific restriction endonuclease McrA
MSQIAFPSLAHKQFMDITKDRYRNMAVRLAKDYHLTLPFTLAQLRDFVLLELGGREDGAIRCRYCGRMCDLAAIALDHAVPLSRGGWVGLNNIELPCAPCNAQKGEMTPIQFERLLEFLESDTMCTARPSILERLQAYSKLLANKRRDEAQLRELKGKP